MEKFLSQLLGTISIADYAAGFVFAMIGAILSLRFEARKRDKDSLNTPRRFSWEFLLQDNIQRLFNGFLLTFVVFRFAPEILNQSFSMFLALGVGAGLDQVAGLWAKVQTLARKR